MQDSNKGAVKEQRSKIGLILENLWLKARIAWLEKGMSEEEKSKISDEMEGFRKQVDQSAEK